MRGIAKQQNFGGAEARGEGPVANRLAPPVRVDVEIRVPRGLTPNNFN